MNCGHTFGEEELSTLNYLLFPRLGDWAIVKVSGDPPKRLEESVARGGFFDEQWAIARPDEEVSHARQPTP